MSDTQRLALRMALQGRLTEILEQLKSWCVHAGADEVRCELYDAIVTAIDRQKPSNHILPEWATVAPPRVVVTLDPPCEPQFSGGR